LLYTEVKQSLATTVEESFGGSHLDGTRAKLTADASAKAAAIFAATAEAKVSAKVLAKVSVKV